MTPLALAALLLAGCAASPASSGGASAADEVVGEWELVSGTAAGALLAQPDGRRATLSLDGAQVGGTSFCNSYGSTYTVDGDALRLAGIGATEMGCEPEIMAAERAYLGALVAVDTVTVDGGQLLLTGVDVELRFQPVTPVPTSDLVGTEWVLESLLDGGSASSTAGEPATLRLTGDGTMTGSTGCRSLTGTWETRSGAVLLPVLSTEGECPEELLAQDDHVIAVLGDGFRADIVEDRLTVTDPDGRGLVYRAS